MAVYLLATWMGSTAYRRHAAEDKAYPLSTQMAALAVFALFPFWSMTLACDLKQTGVVLGIFPFSFLLGYLTPGLIDHYSHGDPDRGGRAYAVNIVGCILGPLAASYLFLPYIGVKHSMILMALPYAAFSLSTREHVSKAREIRALPSTIGLLVGAAFMNHSYEERYDDGIVRRDSTATVISARFRHGQTPAGERRGDYRARHHYQSDGALSAGDLDRKSRLRRWISVLAWERPIVLC